jgi:hypothetical protein
MQVMHQALAALGGPRQTIVHALGHVPDAPGLYAVDDDHNAWVELGLEFSSELRTLYVGKAEASFVRRDLKTHFSTGRTGSSTLRRSFAVLLRNSLDLRGRPRNLAKPERFSNFGLDQQANERAHRVDAETSSPICLGQTRGRGA